MCDQGFPRSGDATQILVGPISQSQAQRLAQNLRLHFQQVKVKPRDLLKICVHTYFIYLMFIFHYIKLVNGV